MAFWKRDKEPPDLPPWCQKGYICLTRQQALDHCFDESSGGLSHTLWFGSGFLTALLIGVLAVWALGKLSSVIASMRTR